MLLDRHKIDPRTTATTNTGTATSKLSSGPNRTSSAARPNFSDVLVSTNPWDATNLTEFRVQSENDHQQTVKPRPDHLIPERDGLNSLLANSIVTPDPSVASETSTLYANDSLTNYLRQSEECQSSILPGSKINCSDKNIYDKMKFCPEEMNFSDFSEVWIRKDLGDILIRVSFIAPILLLGIVGNLTIIYSMCKFKPFRSKPTNIFILNMAVADLLTTIVCPNAALFTDIYQFYVLGSFLCRFEGFVKITCLLVSSYSLIVLSSDWLLCVVKPCRTRISIRQSWLALTAIWIGSIVMAAPLFIWRQLRERQWKDLMEVWCCELIEYTKYYWVVITLFLIYLPIIFMTIVLVIILLQMDKFESKLRRERTTSVTTNSSLSINMKYRRRIVKILVSYLLTSIICWAPLQFTIIYRHFRNEAVPSPWFFQLVFYSQLLASLSAAMNPIIFGFLSQPFRRIVAKSFMFKFLDKMVTTNSRPATANKNDGLAMNQMNLKNRSNNNNNTNNDKHTRSTANRSSQQPLASTRDTNNHTNHNHVNTSFTTNHDRNSKRVSFNTSAINQNNNNHCTTARGDAESGCDNAGFDAAQAVQ